MTWIHIFELLCYLISAALLIQMISGRKVSEMKLFLSGTIVGFALELLAVRVTIVKIYEFR